MPLRWQAIGLGKPLEVVQAEVPAPGAREVVIRLKAVALNPVDWQMLWDDWVSRGILAYDLSETMVRGSLKMSERKSTLSRREMSCLLDSTLLQPGPLLSSVGFMTAASAIYNSLKIPHSFLLDGRADGPSPKSILVLGGSSSVGAATIQLLRLALPIAVIFATSSPGHHALVKSLGATEVFDYKASDIMQQIKSASPDGTGVDALIDVVGSSGRDASLLQTLTGPKLFAELATAKMVQDIPDSINHTVIFGKKVMSAPGAGGLFTALGALLRSGKYRAPLPVEIVGQGLDAIEAGLRKLQAGVSGTKLVVALPAN